MTYNPDAHHRRSIRLKGYDYSKLGAYFVTVCTQGRICLFGKVSEDKIFPNEAGNMIKKWYQKITHRFVGIHCDFFICMPNHIHFILINVGADPCVRPEKMKEMINKNYHVPLSAMVQWFKTMSTNEYIRGVKEKNWAPFYVRLWQRNYWERVIRNEKELIQLRQYIANNPKNWEQDSLNANRMPIPPF